MNTRYPKRLIEVDLPIARISAHSRREKSIRHGHISTLHIWWARRPLAACRAVICASLWPDPGDELCPQAFRKTAVDQIMAFARRVFPEKITEEGRLLSSEKHLSFESRGRWEAIAAGTLTLDAEEPVDMPMLRMCLLDFIADFANWDNSTLPAYLETSRSLTQAAHEALGGVPGTRPLVVDPFAGGGSIPLEALRVGADAFASDLNPVAVLLNKVVLEYIPKYGQRLADEVRKWGQWVKERAVQELAEFYPKDPDGATPIAYLWARTIRCEGPGCGVEIPLLRATNLSSREPIAHVVVEPEKDEIAIKLRAGTEASSTATVRGGKATCPKCGYTTPEKRVKAQTSKVNGGGRQARLYAVLSDGPNGRQFRMPMQHDFTALGVARDSCERLEIDSPELLPTEEINPLRPYKNTVGVCIVTRLGISRFLDLYTERQTCCIAKFQSLVERRQSECGNHDRELNNAVATLLHLAVDRIVMQNSSLSRWNAARSTIEGLFSKQALQVIWDFCEPNPIGSGMANWDGAIDWITRVLEQNLALTHAGTVEKASAEHCPLPDDACDFLFTDPPYFAAIPYADLSDVFYVWLRRGLEGTHPSLFQSELVNKAQELIVTNSSPGPNGEVKDAHFFSTGMSAALGRGRIIAKPSAIGCVVFADSTTSSWESILSAVIDGGWVLTASWPIDTERQTRTRAVASASLQSSVFMVCRPREDKSGGLREVIGEWRDVLSELPQRIHEWMPRLAAEGVVGADAIFACLGPALEIFSRYSRVEKASGEAVPLREYLEQVWAAVSTEALSMIFKDADAAGLEPDARLTAMWLWTLGANAGDANGKSSDDKVTASTGYTLEFDAARKIAQGLGIHLEQSESIIEVKGDKARMLPVSERTRHLFGKDEADARTARGRKKKKTEKQRSLFEELDALESEPDVETVAGELKPQAGETVLDRVHQSMILFASGRGEALRRFLVEDGAGTDARFWKLAQSLSALYPKDTDEKRWVDGVLARKKGLGL
jgi:putative DNA methylase